MRDEKLENQMTPDRKIYKDNAILLGTFFGGPLVAGYIIAENFKSFGKSDSAKKTWLFTILATIIIFVVAFSIPEDVPNQLFPLIYTGIATLVIRYYQREQIQSHIKSGGQVYTWGRVVVIGLIGCVITVIAVLGTVVILDLMEI